MVLCKLTVGKMQTFITLTKIRKNLEKLNNWPGKFLGFLTPNELFYERKKLVG